MTDRLDVAASAALPLTSVFSRLESDEGGLSAAEAARRLVVFGPNALTVLRVSAFAVLVRQQRNPLLLG
jgi:hypothetical protein